MKPIPGVPIACSLKPDELDQRGADWNKMLGDTVASVERPAPDNLRLTLACDNAKLAELIELTRAEKECCPFFGFAFEIATHATVLVVQVPAEAAGILDGFGARAGLLKKG